MIPKAGTRLASAVPLLLEVAVGGDVDPAELLLVAVLPVEADDAAAIDEVVVELLEADDAASIDVVMFALLEADDAAAIDEVAFEALEAEDTAASDEVMIELLKADDVTSANEVVVEFLAADDDEVTFERSEADDAAAIDVVTVELLRAEEVAFELSEADDDAASDEVAVELDTELTPPDVMLLRRLTQLVAAIGQPTPVPLKFCRVTEHAWSRASCEATELSSGKVTATLGLFKTLPAATFLFNSCDNASVPVCSILYNEFALTAMKLSRLIGH